MKSASVVIGSLGILLMTGAVGSMAIVYRGLRSETHRVDRLRTELQGLEARVARLREQRDRAAGQPSLQPSASASEPIQLPDSIRVAEVLELLEVLAGRSGVDCQRISTPKPGSDGRQVFEIKGAGEPRAIATFLALVEQHPRILVVSSVEVSAQPDAPPRFTAVITAHQRTRSENG